MKLKAYLFLRLTNFAWHFGWSRYIYHPSRFSISIRGRNWSEWHTKRLFDHSLALRLQKLDIGEALRLTTATQEKIKYGLSLLCKELSGLHSIVQRRFSTQAQYARTLISLKVDLFGWEFEADLSSLYFCFEITALNIKYKDSETINA